MAQLDLKVGDMVRETSHGRVSHRKHHEGMTAGIPSLRPLRKGVVVEVQGRWFFQGGSDVRVKWTDGSFDWRLADDEHLELVKRQGI